MDERDKPFFLQNWFWFLIIFAFVIISGLVTSYTGSSDTETEEAEETIVSETEDEEEDSALYETEAAETEDTSEDEESDSVETEEDSGEN